MNSFTYRHAPILTTYRIKDIAKADAMKIIEYPEYWYTFCFDCGANLLVSALVSLAWKSVKDRVALFARTTKAGTGTVWAVPSVPSTTMACPFTPGSGCD